MSTVTEPCSVIMGLIPREQVVCLVIEEIEGAALLYDQQRVIAAADRVFGNGEVHLRRIKPGIQQEMILQDGDVLAVAFSGFECFPGRCPVISSSVKLPVFDETDLPVYPCVYFADLIEARCLKRLP